MSDDVVDTYRAMKQDRRDRRARLGVPCPRCAQVRPRATPSTLLPQQRCRVDGYVDPRAEVIERPCPHCGGEGEILPRNERATSPNTIRCRACKGTGVAAPWDCPTCGQRNSDWATECGRCERSVTSDSQGGDYSGEGEKEDPETEEALLEAKDAGAQAPAVPAELEKLKDLLLEGIGWARLVRPHPPLAFIAAAEHALGIAKSEEA
jgi:hypothetical protein